MLSSKNDGGRPKNETEEEEDEEEAEAERPFI